MSELSHPDPAKASAQGADVLAAIRRLLAQDSRGEDEAARNGALLRRLIGTRRQGAGLRPEVAADAAPEADDALSWTQPEVPPLRLADAQRVVPLAGGAAADAVWRAEREAADMLDAAGAAPSDGGARVADRPAVLRRVGPEAADMPGPAEADALPSWGKAEAGGIAAASRPVVIDGADGAAGAAGTVPQASAAVAGKPPADPADAWPLAAEYPLDRVRDLLTFSAWVAEDEAAGIAPPEAAPPAAGIEPAPVAAPAAEAGPHDSPALRAMIRGILLEEIAGEAGLALSEAIHDLTRRAVAGALADMARDMGALHASDGADLH